MCLVIGAFIVLSIRFLFSAQGWDGLFSLKLFYNPETFDFRAVMTATSFAALTYIGFDGVTTLAEDVKNPKRNMLLAPAWCACLPDYLVARRSIWRNGCGRTMRAFGTSRRHSSTFRLGWAETFFSVR